MFTLLAVVPFTSSMTSNLLRSLQTLFGLNPGQRRFYTFMASPKIPWQRLWREIWRLIPEPRVDGRLLVALDDSINNKSGRNIFGCGFFHDHTAKYLPLLCGASGQCWRTTTVKTGTRPNQLGLWVSGIVEVEF